MKLFTMLTCYNCDFVKRIIKEKGIDCEIIEVAWENEDSMKLADEYEVLTVPVLAIDKREKYVGADKIIKYLGEQYGK